MPIKDIALKNYRKQWTKEMGGERGSGRSVVMAGRHDDDDDDDDDDVLINKSVLWEFCFFPEYSRFLEKTRIKNSKPYEIY